MSDLKMIKDDPSFADGKYEENSDAFNHEVFADTIHKIIVENDAPLTIGLFGGWGVGKTSIINLLKRKLSKKDDAFVYFNAWEYGEDTFRRQFLLTVANSDEVIQNKKERSEIVERLEKLNHSDLKKKSDEKLHVSKAGLLKLGIFIIIAIIGIYLIIHGGLDKSLSSLGSGIFALTISIIIMISQRIEQVIKVTIDEAYDPKLIFPEQFAEEFDKIIDIAKTKNKKKNIIIVIDDLDRCEANTIKNILVTMKTFLSRRQCYFIIPMDDSSVVNIFGINNHNFGYEQLRKYFSISVRIPELYHDDLLSYAEKIAKEFKVPADIPYIAALGYCNDARKMKHFLNLYKIKESIALGRKEKGYLAIDLNTIQRQLAKIVVLEYQYPEIYKYLSRYPDKLDVLTRLAFNDSDKIEINYKEINQNLSDGNIWLLYPGLCEFLRNTNDIRFVDFDALSKLKIPVQEKELSIIKEILDSNDYKKLKDVDAKIIQENSSQLVQMVMRYLNSQVARARESAFNFSFLIIREKYLDDFNHKKLLSEVINAMFANRNQLRLTVRFTVDILNNYGELNRYRQMQFGEILEEDIFKQELLPNNTANILNHDEFLNILKQKEAIGVSIKGKVDSYINMVKSKADQKVFINELNKIKYTAQERTDNNLIVPSAEIVASAISFIPLSLEEYDEELFNSIKKLILSGNNPFEFEKVNGFLSAKISSIIKNNITDYDFNNLLEGAVGMVTNSSLYLEEKDAVLIAELIKQHYANFKEDAKLSLLQFFIVATLSIKEDKNLNNNHKSTYNDFVDNLNFEAFKLHNEQIIELKSIDEENKTTIVKENIERKWDYTIDNFNSPNDELINTAIYCAENEETINPENKKSFLLTILDLNDEESLTKWTKFVIDETLKLTDEKQVEITDKALANTKSIERIERIRKQYIQLFLELTEKNNKDKYITAITELVKLLSSDDDFVAIKYNSGKY